jgi:hypothetical protein
MSGRPAGRAAAAWSVVLTVCATLLLVPAPDARADPECRHEDTTLYVPRDVKGESFNFYCVNGTSGIFNNNTRDTVNEDSKQTSLKDWADHNPGLDGQVNFDKLKDEPCQIFAEKASDSSLEGTDINWWRQCARLTTKTKPVYEKARLPGDAQKYASDLKNVPLQFPAKGGKPHTTFATLFEQTKDLRPCDQWRVTYELFALKPDGNLTRNISKCNADNPIFQKMYRVAYRGDENEYDRDDYTAPQAVRDELAPLLGIATWIGYFVCVLGVIICGGMMAVAHRNGEKATIGVVWVMVGAVLIGSASAISRAVLM